MRLCQIWINLVMYHLNGHSYPAWKKKLFISPNKIVSWIWSQKLSRNDSNSNQSFISTTCLIRLLALSSNGPLARPLKLRVAHSTWMPGTFPRHRLNMWLLIRLHNWIDKPRWRGKRSRHSRRIRNPQFYVSCKRPMAHTMLSRIQMSRAPESPVDRLQVLTRYGTVNKYSYGLGPTEVSNHFCNIDPMNSGHLGFEFSIDNNGMYGNASVSCW